jgi:hypothetical protein
MQDSVKFPPKNGILFIGSSSIRKWTDLEQRFSDKPIIRRGVGGCTLEQLVDYYTPYILFPYQPKRYSFTRAKMISQPAKPAVLWPEFTKLWAMLGSKLPKAEVYFMA